MTGAVREIGKLGGIYPSEKQEVTLKADDLALRLQQGRARLAQEEDDKWKQTTGPAVATICVLLDAGWDPRL